MNTANNTTACAKTQAKTPLEVALEYIARGWSVTPIEYRAKHPPPRASWAKEYLDLRIDASNAPQYFNGARSNIGILLGEPSGGLVDIDLDCPEAIALAPSILPDTLCFGRATALRSHWLYSAPGMQYEKLSDPDLTGGDATILELRGNRKMTVFPGSTHKDTGEAIEWSDPTDNDPPRSLDDEDAGKLLKSIRALAACVLIIRSWNNRQDLTLYLTGALLKAGYPVETVRSVLAVIIQLVGDEEPRKRESAIEATIRKYQKGDESAIAGISKLKELMSPGRYARVVQWLGLKGTTKPLVLGCTDADNARRFAARFERDARYCRPWKDWLLYEGGRWVRDERGQTVLMAEIVARSIFEEAARADQKDEAMTLSKWANSSLNKRGLDAMVSLAQSHLAISPGEFDQAPWLFNVRNGTVDLSTGELRQPDRDELLTKQAPVLFDANAACPTWERFLLEIMGGNDALVDYLRRAAGYSLTGSTREQCLFILYGTGRNGKSTFIETLNAALGEYSRKAEMRAFLNKGDNAGVNNDIAALRGARLVSAVEIGAERRLNEPLIKEITGGDTITARFLYEEFFQFKPEFKVFLAVNHKPVIKGTDEGIWRRVRLVPFDVTIAPDKVDKDLPDKLQAELPGILNWEIGRAHV